MNSISLNVMMIMMKCFYGLLLGLALHIVFSTIVSAKGLSLKFDRIPEFNDRFITAFDQDRYGFLWIGTLDGLLRYDGFEVVEYRDTGGTSGELRGNYIEFIKHDRNENLWIGTDHGLNRFEHASNSFTYLRRKQSEESYHVKGIFLDKKERLWVFIKQDGIYLYNPKTQLLEMQYHDQHAFTRSGICDPIEDTDGFIWYISNFIIHRYDSVNNRVQAFPDENLKYGSVVQLPDGKFMGVTFGTTYLNLFDPHTKLHSIIDLRYINNENDDQTITETLDGSHITIDEMGIVWIAYQQFGLGRYDPLSNQLNFYRYSPNDRNALSVEKAIRIFFDRSGLLWVGGNNGVCKTALNDKFIYPLHVESKTGLPINIVGTRTMYEDKYQNIWVGARDGLYKLNPKLELVGIYSSDQLESPISPQGEILEIDEGPNDQIYVLSNDNFSRYDIEKNIFEILLRREPESKQSFWWDSQNSLWLGLNIGLLFYDQEIKPLLHPKNLSITTKIKTRIDQIVEDQNGDVWLESNEDGLYRINVRDNTFDTYKHNPSNPNSLSSNWINRLFIDQKNRVWATTNHGLNQYIPETDSFQRITIEDGLASKRIKGIQDDSDGTLWLSTHKGISHYNPVTKSIRNYKPQSQDGNYFYWASASIRLQDGRILFGHSDGVDVVDPSLINKNFNESSIVFTSMQIQDEPLRKLGNDWNQLEPFELPYWKNSIAFQFALPDFINPLNNVYQSKLIGLQEHWQPVVGNQVIFPFLPPGDYTFQVRGINPDGNWSQRAASVSFMILPPFWLRWWFHLLFWILVIGIFLTIVYSLRRQLRLEKERRAVELKTSKELQVAHQELLYHQQQLRALSAEVAMIEISERRQIASDLHDRIGQALAMCKFHLEAKIANTVSKEWVSFLSGLCETIKQTIFDTKHLTFEISPPTLYDVGLEAAVDELIEQLQDKYNLRFILKHDYQSKPLTNELRSFLFRAVRELLINVIKHAQATQVIVNITKNNENIQIVVEDDGIGFNTHSIKNKGFGLFHLKERLKYFGGNLTIDSIPPHGTRVILTTRLTEE